MERRFRLDVGFTIDVGRRNKALAALGRVARSKQNHVTRNVFILSYLDDIPGLPMTRSRETYTDILPHTLFPVTTVALPREDRPRVRLPIAPATFVLENAHVNSLRADNREK